jgi:hypothetical protein
MGLAWAGYTGMLWAYCLIRGYDVTLGQLVNPVHQLNWKTATGKQIPQGQIMPGAANAGSAQQTFPGTNEVAPTAGNQCPPGFGYDPRSKRCVPLVSPNVEH